MGHYENLSVHLHFLYTWTNMDGFSCRERQVSFCQTTCISKLVKVVNCQCPGMSILHHSTTPCTGALSDTCQMMQQSQAFVFHLFVACWLLTLIRSSSALCQCWFEFKVYLLLGWLLTKSTEPSLSCYISMAVLQKT